VNYAKRQAALEKSGPLEELVASWANGNIKQALLRRLLDVRASQPEFFANAGYQPLQVNGVRAMNVIGFVRKTDLAACLVVAPRCCAEGVSHAEGLVPKAGWWGDTEIILPQGNWHAIIGPEPLHGRLNLSDALPHLPIGVWWQTLQGANPQ
jgi:(1->4)-alpha-D-glucan 1-alpha-D-glucosylmutase